MSDIRLLCGDCLELLPSIGAETVDLVFADPPFNIGKKYNGSAKNDRRDDYRSWCEAWICECFRILKPTGSIYLMTLDKHLEWQFPIMAQHGVFINLVRWRNVSASHTKRKFWVESQPIMVYGKTDQYLFNARGELRKIAAENLRWGGYTTGPIGFLFDYWNDIPFVYAGSSRHPEAIIEAGTNRKAHPAQMPVKLAARAMYFSSPADGIVLDPFMGTGTTMIACQNLGRRGVGIEIVTKYFEIARKRVYAAQNQIRTDLELEAAC